MIRTVNTPDDILGEFFKDPKRRANWPLPSMDAKDWADAFQEHMAVVGYEKIEDKLLLAWFSNALYRGYCEAENLHEVQRKYAKNNPPWRSIEDDPPQGQKSIIISSDITGDIGMAYLDPETQNYNIGSKLWTPTHWLESPQVNILPVIENKKMPYVAWTINTNDNPRTYIINLRTYTESNMTPEQVRELKKHGPEFT